MNITSYRVVKKFNSCCIVDDDEFFAFKTKKLMRDSDFCDNTLVYSDGQDAIDALVGLLIENVKLPDIILLDLNMPRKDGWEFLDDFIKIPLEQREHCAVYITSSFVSQKNLVKAKTYDVVKAYLVKPFKEDSLKQIIETSNS